jgi:hypothetical protein
LSSTDGRDLPVRIYRLDQLGDVWNGRLEATIAPFHFAGLEAFGDLLDERHFVGFFEKRCNN